MCGIAGIVDRVITKDMAFVLERMLASLAERGPDGSGSIQWSRCILGHTRLSILDIAGGHQPMREKGKDVAISFNGEIYNYRELREDLKAFGHTFSTSSDTEVLLKSFLHYGPECLQYLEGMFAFAVWDEQERALFIARDRFGKKPLYYAIDESGRVVFASEIKAIIASGLVAPEFDESAFDSYLQFMYLPPSKTIYKNIHTLAPGHWARITAESIHVESYWSLKPRPVLLSYQDAVEEVRELLKRAVAKRMIADVEIGMFLSGGVDSTIVTAFAQRVAVKPLKAFVIRYGDDIDEVGYAETAAKAVGCELYVTNVAGESLVQSLTKVSAYLDEPNADSSNISQCVVSQLAHQMVKVVLSGDGGDEVFCGYDWYLDLMNRGMLERCLQAVKGTALTEFINRRTIFTSQERSLLLADSSRMRQEVFKSQLDAAGGSSDLRCNLFDLSVYLPGQLLTKIDRMGMMNSLEVRSPLLDHKLVELVFNLPSRYKVDGVNAKLLLKHLLCELLPEEFVYRKKQGFGAPVRKWLNTYFKECTQDLLGSRSARVGMYLEASYVQRLVSDFYAGQEKLYWKVWTLLCLEMWLRHRPII